MTVLFVNFYWVMICWAMLWATLSNLRRRTVTNHTRSFFHTPRRKARTGVCVRVLA